MATYTKRLSIQFYHVECKNGKFESFVNKANKSHAYRKHFKQSPFDITMDTFEESQAFVCGHFVKTRMDDIDPKYNINTFKTESMPLEDDEGIPTGSVWLYFKKLRILFFQKTLMGVSTNQFCEYFEKYSGTGAITLKHVLSEEGFRRLTDIGHISKIEIAIKGLDKGYVLREVGAAKEVMKKMRELQPNIVKIEVSKGNRGRGLDLTGVRRFATDFYDMMKSMVGSDADNNDGDSNSHIVVTG